MMRIGPDDHGVAAHDIRGRGCGGADEHLGLLIGVWGRVDGLLEREDLVGAAMAHLDHHCEAAPAKVTNPVEVRRLP
jgi:hypothetical protein